MYNLNVANSALLLALIPLQLLSAQSYRVSLEVVHAPVQSMGTSAEIKTDASGRLSSTLPGSVEVRIERMPGEGIIARIQGGDPAAIALLPGQDALVRLDRKVGQLASATYVLGYSRRERDNVVSESLFWMPAYRAEGRLKLSGCEARLFVLDFNGDGVFDDNDSRRGTTLGIDANNDGRFYGAGEYHKLAEVIDICGQLLTVAALDPSGNSITFQDSDLKPAQVNAPLPNFSILTTAGRRMKSKEIRGKVHLFDFWASWCAPCVAKLSEMEKLARERPKELVVVGINVDQADRCGAAAKIVKEKQLSFQQVMRCQGERDFLWKTFGSAQGAGLSVPLYVVVDKEGLIRYAGRGRDDLQEVKDVLRKLLDTP